MKKYGLQRGKDGLQVYLMAELPSNILMAEEFAQHIDGFSIGSNDLTQLTLGLDRDSSLVAHIYDERNPAVKRSISNLIKVAKKTKTKVGICGQGPSDYPDFAQFLVEEGIDTISVTPDSMLKTIKAIHKIENKNKNMMIKGGEFLIKDQEAKDIFIPEDFGEDQLMMASATKEFVEKELDPHRERFEKKDYQTY